MGQNKASLSILTGFEPVLPAVLPTVLPAVLPGHGLSENFSSKQFDNEHGCAEHGSNEHGATMMEYVLIVCCLMLVAISSVSMVGAESRDTFHQVRSTLAHSNFPVGSTPPLVEPD